MKVIIDEKKIDEILTRGVHEVFTKEDLRKQLLSGEQLHFKLGTDVTGAFLHLGHSVIHRKLRDFQELVDVLCLVHGSIYHRLKQSQLIYSSIFPSSLNLLLFLN